MKNSLSLCEALGTVWSICHARYRGASLIRNKPSEGTYISPTPGALWWSQGVGVFL